MMREVCYALNGPRDREFNRDKYQAIRTAVAVVERRAGLRGDDRIEPAARLVMVVEGTPGIIPGALTRTMNAFIAGSDGKTLGIGFEVHGR